MTGGARAAGRLTPADAGWRAKRPSLMTRVPNKLLHTGSLTHSAPTARRRMIFSPAAFDFSSNGRPPNSHTLRHFVRYYRYVRLKSAFDQVTLGVHRGSMKAGSAAGTEGAAAAYRSRFDEAPGFHDSSRSPSSAAGSPRQSPGTERWRIRGDACRQAGTNPRRLAIVGIRVA